MENFKYDYLSVINYILEKYEIGETFWILNGLEVVGIENSKIWLEFVEYIKKTGYFKYLPSYVLIMKRIIRKDLLISVDDVFDASKYKTSKELYLVFINMLNKVCVENEEKIKK